MKSVRQIAAVLAGGGLVVATLCVVADSFRSSSRILWYHSNVSYYVMWVLVLLWMLALVRHLRQTGFAARPFLRDSIRAAGVAALVTAILLLCNPPCLRIFADETNYLNVSRSFHYEQKAMVYQSVISVAGDTTVVSWALPITPVLFPFVTSLLHLPFGYQYTNVFILNAWVCFVFLMVVYRVARRILGADGYACGAVLLAAACPALAYTASSGGYDVFFVLLLLTVFVAVWAYLSRPSAAALALLWLTVLLICHTRREAILLAGWVPLVLVAGRQVRWQDIRANLLLWLATPLLLLPYAWPHLFYRLENPVYTGVRPDLTPHGSFSMRYLVDNGWAFLSNQWDASGVLPYASALNVLALAMGAVLVVRLVRGQLALDAPRRTLAVCVAGFVALQLGVLFFYYAGVYNNTTDYRYFLAWCMFCALIPLAFVKYVYRLKPVLFLVVAAGLFVAYRPLTIREAFLKNHVAPYEMRVLYQLLHDRLTPAAHALIVSDVPDRFVILNQSSVDFTFAARNSARIRDVLKKQGFNEVIVIERLDLQTQSLPSRIPPDWSLALIAEYRVGDGRHLRVSRLVL